MSAFKDISNQRFGRLVALRAIRDEQRARFLWECQCDCGGTKLVLSNRLKSGEVRSCGCLRTEAAKRAGAANVTHGMTNTKVFRIWVGMHSRCTNPKETGYENYGGRGIRVCDRWQSFEAFLSDMGEPPSSRHQIDRERVNENYEPGNCRWATPKENCRNRRNNRIIEFDGKSLCITEWASRIGVTHQALRRRIDILNWPVERALTEGKLR